MMQLLPLALFCLACFENLAQSEAASTNSYARIGRYLIEHVRDEHNVRQNLDSVYEMKRAEKSKTESLVDLDLLSTLVRFSSLSKINPKNQCTIGSYHILNSLEEDIRDFYDTRKGKDFRESDEIERVDTIIQDFVTNRAKSCQDEHTKIFKAKFELADREIRDCVQDFIQTLMRPQRSPTEGSAKYRSFGEYFQSKPHLAINSISRIGTICGPATTRVAFETVEKFVKQYEPEQMEYLHEKSDVGEEKIKKLFKKYLVDPCERYTKSFEPLIIPAVKDFATTSGEILKNPNKDLADFYTGWASYKLCNILVTRDQEALLADLLDYVGKEYLKIHDLGV